jgi:hypothetical protein
MSALHTTPSRRTGRKVAIPSVTPPVSGEAGLISQLAQSAANRSVDPEVKEAMIAEAAYYCAEKRGFAPGHELEDWLEAKAQIELALSK